LDKDSLLTAISRPGRKLGLITMLLDTWTTARPVKCRPVKWHPVICRSG